MKKQKKPNKKLYIILLITIVIASIFFFFYTQNNKVLKELRFSDKTTNYIENMSFTDKGIKLTIKMNSENLPHLELCQKSKCFTNGLTEKETGLYEGLIITENLANGLYDIYIGTDKLERVVDTRKTAERIQRTKIGGNLITLDYSDNKLKLKQENFKYEYDILIDPGHGGSDIGSYNKYINEEKLNLEQSFYEKKRFEEHGLEVKMIRDDNSYGIKMGDDNWSPVRKRAFALGYHGVLAKVVYSNHHNSSEYQKSSGWEIIVPASIEQEKLSPEKIVAAEWEKKYKILEKHIRFYARNESNGEILSRRKNETYTFRDYYAVIRIPRELFQVKNILYEGCYLSNLLDFDWYYTKGNWKQLSESKIKAYVEHLGKKYIVPKV